MFAVAYSALLKPLPYREPERLVSIGGQAFYAGAWQLANYSASDLTTWRSRQSAFDDVAASAVMSFAMGQMLGSVSINGAFVSANFFDTIGGQLSRGRFPSREEHARPVALISHRLWMTAFGGDLGAVGRSIILDNRAYLIVGIAGPEFALPDERIDVWTPADYAATTGVDWITNPRGGGFELIARLRRGETLRSAQASADAIARTSDFRPTVQSLTDAVTVNSRPILRLLFSVVGLVLAVACANLATFQSARNMSRRRELAILTALGARRAALAASACSEVVLLCIAGGGLGLLFAREIVAVLPHLPGMAPIPRIAFAHVGLPVMVFTAAVTCVTLWVVSALSLRGTGWRDPLPALSSESLAVAGGGTATRVRKILVAIEVAVCVVLLAGAMLLIRSLDNVLRIDTGVDADHVLTAFLDLGSGAAALTDERHVATAILDRLQSHPGVAAAGISTSLPPSVTRARIGFKLPRPDGSSVDHMADLVPSSPDLFRTLRIPLVAGRAFSERDSASAPSVTIISKSTAERLFGGENPLDRVIPIGPRRAPATIIGVVGDVKYHGLTAAAPLTVYIPFDQRSFPFRMLYVFVRTSGRANVFASELRRAIADVDPQIAVVRIESLEDVVASASSEPALRTSIVVGMAAIALLLALIGMAGVVAYSVSQRTREIGVRLALGASPRAIGAMVVSEAARIGFSGIAIGLVGSLAFARLLGAQLYGVRPHDPVSFGCAALLLLAVTLVAGYIPARRASSLDPVVALRSD